LSCLTALVAQAVPTGADREMYLRNTIVPTCEASPTCVGVEAVGEPGYWRYFTCDKYSEDTEAAQGYHKLRRRRTRASPGRRRRDHRRRRGAYTTFYPLLTPSERDPTASFACVRCTPGRFGSSSGGVRECNNCECTPSFLTHILLPAHQIKSNQIKSNQIIHVPPSLSPLPPVWVGQAQKVATPPPSRPRAPPPVACRVREDGTTPRELPLACLAGTANPATTAP
jgi:hypothetical protein